MSVPCLCKLIAFSDERNYIVLSLVSQMESILAGNHGFPFALFYLNQSYQVRGRILKEFRSPASKLSYYEKLLICVLENLRVARDEEGAWKKRDGKEVNKRLCCLSVANISFGFLLKAVSHYLKLYCSVNGGQRLRTLRLGVLGKSQGYVGLSASCLLAMWSNVNQWNLWIKK